MKQLEKYADHAYALMRIVAGFMFAFHGAQKVLGILSEFQPPMGSQLWIGGVIELVGGLAVLLGFGTRIAAFICSGEMAVAYFQFHFPQSFWPSINGGDAAVLFCFVWLYISAAGAGPWSLDAIRRK